MQAQLACMLLLCLTCGALCTDVDREQRALEEELLSSLFTSKMVSTLRQEAWSGEEEEEEDGGPKEANLQLLEELYNLEHICRALQNREERLLQDSLEYSEENSDTPLKRKSPYILKRQAGHTTKTRRPYILKRSTFY